MKSAIQACQDVYRIINISDVTSLLTGDIFLFERPKNSTNDDIVINSLAITYDQFQQAVVNVNLHMQNIHGLLINNQADETQPDVAKTSNVVEIIKNLINSVNGQDFALNLASGQMVRDNDFTWYYNFRVNYTAVQKNFINV